MITTYTGKDIDPFDLQPDDISIIDIAHALSCVNRFGGHAIRPISVAQHSVEVARLCSPENQLQGLLHDASEAYLGDVTRWLKRSEVFSMYRTLEAYVQAVIFKRYGCPLEMNQEVVDVDNLMVRFEGWKAYGNGLNVPKGQEEFLIVTPEEVRRVGNWEFWGWGTSKETFLNVFEMLYFKEAQNERTN